MTELDRSWCDLGGMEAWMCGCRIHAKAKGLDDVTQEEADEWPPPGEVVIIASTYAKHQGTRCHACQETIKVGDAIVLVEGFGRWIHTHCAEKEIV